MDTKVCILGTGNVAWHLEHWLAEAGIEVRTCSARTPDDWPEADIYMLAIADKAIREVAQKLQKRNAIVVHLSGTTSIDALNVCQRKGVIYPVQTFTKESHLNYSEIPLLVEGSAPEVTEHLWQLAGKMTCKLIKANSNQRRQIHLAGVIASNFTNHLLLLACIQLKNSGLSPETLWPLIKETLNKAIATGPFDAQTGPARRNDMVTMATHLEMLSDEPRIKEIYRLISSSIYDTYSR